MNRDRIEKHLPIIPGNWELYRNLGTQVEWVNPAFQAASTYPTKTGRSMHAMKQLLLDETGKRLRESDTYYSGKKYPEVGGDSGTLSDQRLEVIYKFGKSDEKGTWEFELNCGPEIRPRNLEEAESILERWGITRLNRLEASPSR